MWQFFLPGSSKSGKKKSMNMFKVMITVPKTLSQTLMRLCQVNNIIAKVFGTPPPNLFLIERIPDYSKSLLALGIHGESIISPLLNSHSLLSQVELFLEHLPVPPWQPQPAKTGLRALCYGNASSPGSIKSYHLCSIPG